MDHFSLSRVYDKRPAHGRVVLVERLWPRGIARATLHLDAWLKDVAPSTELRKWFSHDPAKWEEFRERYFAELDAHPAAWQELVTGGPVTLLYSSHDVDHNNAVALRDYLIEHTK